MKFSTLLISQEDFNRLPEYSLSVPTGAILGKRWKRRKHSTAECNEFYIGEYVRSNEPGYLDIKWYEPEIMTENQELISKRLFK